MVRTDLVFIRVNCSVFPLFEALVSKVRCQKKEGETMKEKRQNGIGRKIKRRKLVFKP